MFNQALPARHVTGMRKQRRRLSGKPYEVLWRIISKQDTNDFRIRYAWKGYKKDQGSGYMLSRLWLEVAEFPEA